MDSVLAECQLSGAGIDAVAGYLVVSDLHTEGCRAAAHNVLWYIHADPHSTIVPLTPYKRV